YKSFSHDFYKTLNQKNTIMKLTKINFH
ncbi:hypothetical protein, partial [Plasmodium yoelii yoelii]